MLALVMLCYGRTVQPLVLAGRMVDYAPLSGLGLFNLPNKLVYSCLDFYY